MTSKKAPYLYDNTTIISNYTFLNNTPPLVSGFNVTVSGDGGCGYTFIYSVFINVTQNDNVSCKLWVHNGSAWLEKGSMTVYGGLDTCYILVNDFGCGDISNYTMYQFELYDNTNRFNTSNQSGLNITRDDVLVYYAYGDGENVTRSGSTSTLLVVGINDTDRGNVPVGSGVEGIFWITADGENYTYRA